MTSIPIIERDPRGLGRVVNWAKSEPLRLVVQHYRARGMRLRVQDGRIVAHVLRGDRR